MNKNEFSHTDPQKSTTSSASSTSGSADWSGAKTTLEGLDKDKGSRRSSQQGSQPHGDGMSMDKIRDVGKNLGEQLETQMKDRPYVVLGAVAGVGFVAGSLLGSRLGQVAIALAGGYLVRNMIKGGGGGEVQRIVKEGIDKLTQERSAG
jgi:ElaB/YqjD/DUF883 family membrane-anchored ribosome-binding protein